MSILIPTPIRVIDSVTNHINDNYPTLNEKQKAKLFKKTIELWFYIYTVQQKEIREGFRRLQCNLAYYKYVNGYLRSDLIKYLRSFNVIPEVGIKGMIEFISDDLWAPYIMVYQGEQLITDKYGIKPSPAQFRKLLCEHTSPSELL